MDQIHRALVGAVTSQTLVLAVVLRFLVVLIALGLAAWIINEAIRWFRERTGPLATLAQRYARGEVDRDEYYLRRADLLRTQSPAPAVQPVTPIMPVMPPSSAPMAVPPQMAAATAEPPHRRPEPAPAPAPAPIVTPPPPPPAPPAVE